MQGMYTLGGWWGMDWWERLQYKWWQGMSEALKPAWRGCAGSWKAEMKQKLQCGCLDY